MKNLILIVSLLGSFGAYAMEIKETYDAETGDVSALVKDPTYPKTSLSFSASSAYSSSPSSEDGVCKVLGYEKAAPGSSRSDKITDDVVRVDSDGTVVEGPNAYTMTQIVCLNPAKSPTILETLVILTESKLVHPQSNLPFSASSAYSSSPSSEDGVCRVLGYRRAIIGSSRSEKETADTIQVDSDGNVVGGPNAYTMTRIICANS